MTEEDKTRIAALTQSTTMTVEQAKTIITKTTLTDKAIADLVSSAINAGDANPYKTLMNFASTFGKLK